VTPRLNDGQSKSVNYRRVFSLMRLVEATESGFVHQHVTLCSERAFVVDPREVVARVDLPGPGLG
jgi:hypothetical protein